MLHKTVSENIGLTDKAIRAIVGIALIIAGAHYKSWLVIFGTFLLVTAIIGFCPVYSVFRLSTASGKMRRRRHRDDHHKRGGHVQ
jgi:hypothetical protein